MVFLWIIAFFLRLYGINWDQGFHLHPDERMLIIVADRIHFFDKLDPQFFNYGTLPIYLLKGVSQLIDWLFGTSLATYDGMLVVGRLLSVAFDMGTMVLIYLIALSLFKKKSIALYAMFTYAFSFFAIQNTHFFVVDVFLTFFITAAVYFMLSYLQKPNMKSLVLLALVYAAALATKISAIIFAPVLILVFFLPLWKKRNVSTLYESLKNVALFVGLTALLHAFFMPYTYLSWSKFVSDTLEQTKMSKNAYIFPYTLQYVSTLPYIYYLKNIFLWGMGPLLSFFSLAGLYEFISESKTKKTVKMTHMILLTFYGIYFLIIGLSAVKFMRYMLPLYPFFALLAGVGLERLKTLPYGRYLFYVSIALTIIWTGCFVNIYSEKHTRIEATNWILQNIPAGSVIATEHWDDRVPLVNSERYQYVEMTLYDQPDDAAKWSILNQKLAVAQYVLLASNRLYVPLQKLADCTKYHSCYPKTTHYYQQLFNGELGFKKIYETNVSPHFTLFGHTFTIDDQGADESFTVYDHPKIIVFKKS